MFVALWADPDLTSREAVIMMDTEEGLGLHCSYSGRQY